LVRGVHVAGPDEQVVAVAGQAGPRDVAAEPAELLIADLTEIADVVGLVDLVAVRVDGSVPQVARLLLHLLVNNAPVLRIASVHGAGRTRPPGRSNAVLVSWSRRVRSLPSLQCGRRSRPA